MYVTFYFVFQAEKNVKRYGKVLMAEVPQETTELLKRLCTDYRPTDSQYIFCVFIKSASSVHYVYLSLCMSDCVEFQNHLYGKLIIIWGGGVPLLLQSMIFSSIVIYFEHGTSLISFLSLLTCILFYKFWFARIKFDY